MALPGRYRSLATLSLRHHFCGSVTGGTAAARTTIIIVLVAITLDIVIVIIDMASLQGAARDWLRREFRATPARMISRPSAGTLRAAG